MNNRRKLLVALGAGAFAAPLGSFAQQQGKSARVGFLYFASRQSALDTGRYNAFVQGMRELGYVSGTNLVIEERYADGKIERVAGLAGELVRLKVDAIVATGAQFYRALPHATTTIPIVTTVATDPVRDGYAASMARPGGNFTGLTTTAVDLGPKLLELVIIAVTKLSRVTVVVHPDNAAHPPQLMKIMAAAQRIGVQVILAEARSKQDIDREFATMARDRVGAAIFINDSFYVENLRYIAAQALKNRMPSIIAIHEYADAGGLMSYGPNLVDNFHRAAIFVDKILKGTKPGDLPFEQPTRYFLTINRKTATALGLTISNELLLRADKVIE